MRSINCPTAPRQLRPWDAGDSCRRKVYSINEGAPPDQLAFHLERGGRFSQVTSIDINATSLRQPPPRQETSSFDKYVDDGGWANVPRVWVGDIERTGLKYSTQEPF